MTAHLLRPTARLPPRKLFNWCVARDMISLSPCAGVKPPSEEQSRERKLDDEELRLVWHAADELGWPFGPMVKLLILTGQRRDEVARMEWGELDLEKKLWTLPKERIKNNEPHNVPLSDVAIAILEALPRWVSVAFSTNGKHRPRDTRRVNVASTRCCRRKCRRGDCTTCAARCQPHAKARCYAAGD